MSKKAKEENKEKVLEEKQNVEEKKEEIVEVKETDAKKKASKKKDKKEKKNKNKEGYFKLLKEQMKLVIWPNGKEIFKYTFSTILFILVFVLFFQLIDVISSFVKGLF